MPSLRKWLALALVYVTLLSLATAPSLCARSIVPPDSIGAWGFCEGTVLERGEIRFALGGSTHVARWTMQYLTTDGLQGAAERSGKFFADELVPVEFRATNADYESSGFDRGHLCPAADFHGEANEACFSLAVMAPQKHSLNAGLWKTLEREIREKVARSEVRARAWVITVPLYLPDARGQVRYQVIGPHHIAVPTHFGKAALFMYGMQRSPSRLEAWIIPHDVEHGKLTDDFRVSVDQLEAAAGLDFWPKLDAELQTTLEEKDI